MKELVEVMAKSLVNDPSAVVVEEETTGTTTVLRLHVASEDMGKVIGKQGRIAKAIRTVMKAVATRQIDIERNKRTAAKQEAEAKLKRAEALELGAEIGHGTLERTVEITVGTNIDTLMGAEILTEDGKVIAFRE